MSRKVRIIIATVIVAIALILFGIVLLLQPKSKGKDTEASQTYATASTVDQTQTTTTDPSGEIIVGDDISADAVYTHIERRLYPRIISTLTLVNILTIVF